MQPIEEAHFQRRLDGERLPMKWKSEDERLFVVLIHRMGNYDLRAAEYGLPPVPNGTSDALVFWILMTQCALLSCASLELTPQSFGAPPGFGPQGVAIGDWRR